MTCPEEIKQMWEIVKESFKGSMSSAAFEMWYGSLQPAQYLPDTNELVFESESEFKCKKLSEQHKPLIEQAFRTEAGIELVVSFRFVGTTTTPQDIISRISGAKSGIPAQPQPVSPAESAQLSKYTFDNFIIGASNRFARAACWKVASTQAFNEYNPLFIYGPSGVGKTHLMYAVINEMRRTNPGIRVIYTKGEDFTNNMVAHLTHGTMASFREMYRGCDVLLVDDIQFIAGKEATQNEVFHTFQALFDEGKQIILASDRPPKDINPLEERLRSRFEQGLIADINPPDLELRVAIIKKKAEDIGVDVPNDVLTFLAENVRSNIRQIEGSIKKLAAISMLDGRRITLSMAQEIIHELLGDAEPLDVTIDKVFAALFKKYNMPREAVVGKKRNKELVFVRHVAIYLIRDITELSFPRISKIFNRDDHTAAIYSYNWVQERITKDPLFASDMELLKKEICGN